MSGKVTIERKVKLRDLFKGKVSELFLDIETLFYNKNTKNPSDYKNRTWSLAIARVKKHTADETIIQVYRSHNFNDFFEYLNGSINRAMTIKCYYHNGNKYDNHFMLWEFKRMYGEAIETHLNKFSKKAKSLEPELAITNKEMKEHKLAIAESRVKSKTNLDLTLQINKVQLQMIDTVPKVASSLGSMTDKLVQYGFMPQEYAKTTLEYDKYDIDENVSDAYLDSYILDIYNNLTPDENIYIDNDVIGLAFLRLYYSQIFEGFDWDKATLSQNIGEYYITLTRDEENKPVVYNTLARWQLYSKVWNSEMKTHVKYTDFAFGNGSGALDENYEPLDPSAFAFIKSFYKGGLNFYNSEYVAKVIHERAFSIDINSSYPYAMYFGFIPTYLHEAMSYDNEMMWHCGYEFEDLEAGYNPESRYCLWRITYETFNQLIKPIKSRIIKEMLVKYYNNLTPYVNINTNTIKIINMFRRSPVVNFPIISYMIWDCYRFGAKETIKKLYTDKTNGKAPLEVTFDDNMHATEGDKAPLIHFSEAQYAQFKVLLNGIYGIPALRPAFNRFEYKPDKDDYENYINDNENTERNVMFSVFVTSMSLLNLLTPLTYLSAKEIDKNFLYADTDSLYLKHKIRHKLPDSLFSPYDLGLWDEEHYNITDMYILNHKKYAYATLEEKKGETKPRIEVRSGGINKGTWDTNMSFDNFIATQFFDGSTVQATRSILNKQGTITLYTGSITMEKGTPYPIEYNERDKNELARIVQEIRNSVTDNEDSIYYETPFGAISEDMIFSQTTRKEHYEPIEKLIAMHSIIGGKIRKTA